MGTEAICGAALPSRELCQLPQKKVLFLMMGPPMVAPNWFWMNEAWPPDGWKYGVASSFELRRNSKTLPWKLLVPDFMVTFTTPPAACPNSAEKVAVCTLNS